jgi:ABC-type multidrug transport system ATPase subunit
MLAVDRLAKIFEPPAGLWRLLVRTASDTPVHALHDVSFEVAPGQVVGLVGPNGAGKSTLIRLCAGLLTPSSGRVLLDGGDPLERPEVRHRSLGLVLADDRALYWRLSGRDNLRFFGVMSGLSWGEARERADELLEQFDLARHDRRVFGYSSGMRVKLSLARAMMHRPRTLILDEPSRSLDPMAGDDLVDRLRALADGGVAVLLSSHRLDEVEAVCDRVEVILRGRIAASVPVAGLPVNERGRLRALLDDDPTSRHRSSDGDA